jgi:predicted transcriptional regulator
MMENEVNILGIALTVADYLDNELAKDPSEFITVHRLMVEQASSFARAAAAIIEAKRAGYTIQ